MSDTELKRLLQPASSTGCFRQQDKTVGINDGAVDGNSDCDVMAVAVFLFSRLVHACDTNNPAPLPGCYRCCKKRAGSYSQDRLVLVAALIYDCGGTNLLSCASAAILPVMSFSTLQTSFVDSLCVWRSAFE